MDSCCDNENNKNLSNNKPMPVTSSGTSGLVGKSRHKKVSFRRNIRLGGENESENERLLLGAICNPEEGSEKSRHKCTRFSSAGCLLRHCRSRLVGRFGHFLDTRNAVSEEDPVGGSGHSYDKIANNNNNQLQTRLDKSVSVLPSHFRSRNQNRPIRYNSQHLACSEPDFCKTSCTRRRCQLLLGAIVNRRRGLDKTSLFLSLLRAPIVLAAIFSLLLFVSLMTLYTMTFAHYHHYLQDHNLKLCQEQQVNNKSVPITNREVSIERQKEDDNSEIGGLHLITSRHLLQAHPGSGEDRSREAFERALTVQTECGGFVGSPEQSAIVFKGIPYATPPVGPRRWTRPRPVWLDPELCQARRISETLEYREHCAQVSPMTHRFTGHEDCLYLDIYVPRLAPQIGAPANREKKLPVMVYIHGGFLSFGSSGSGRPRADQADQVNWMRAKPSGRLASELGIVLVAFNYRLQALGFMTLLQLAQNNGPFGSEGNYGLWDQLTALNWIKRNIESFGGDPNNVVLFGPDSASALPLATLSQGFRSVGRQSGPPSGGYDEEAPGKQEEGIELDEEEEGKKLSSKVKMMSLAGGPAGATLPNLTINRATAALDANQIDSVPASSPEVSAGPSAGAETGKLDTHDLFRAAWLANPTVYYELPYELANQHYQRLFLNQSPCRPDWSQKVSPAHYGSWAEGSARPEKLEDGENNESLPEMIRAQGGKQTRASAADKGQNQMLDCLMSLSGEQVVRYYLGKDNPSYRLDDQNSLPIHGIFADQFVTLDRELVRHSYPFGSFDRGCRKSESSRSPVGAKQRVRLDENNSPLPGKGGIRSPSSSRESPITNNNNNDNNGAPAAKAHYKPAGLNDSSGNYPAACQQPASQGNLPSLLLGSTAQAVEYWPCPTNLNHWNWTDFKRYTATSLNSFAPNTYTQAANLYRAPPLPDSREANSSHPRRSPKETYLTMTSDIRQVCPINELAVSLNSIRTEQQATSVFRYVVEHRPSSAFPVAVQEASKPEFSFHNWDLIAFFGFEFEPEFSPTDSDRRFQAQIREMVREFVFGEANGKNSFFNDDIQLSGLAKSLPALVLGLDGNRKRVFGYKREECAMWRRQLGRSYAWVS